MKKNTLENVDVLLCMGTRPEIIKMMPVYLALKKRGITTALLHTGQHEDMAHRLYDLFNMPVDLNLHLTRKSHALSELTSSLLNAISGAIEQYQPKAILVHGDTTSALTAAICAFYRKIPVGHVEAGLRTGERYSPFPEEKNREIIARLAHWHFCPTELAARHLRNEGINEGIMVTGNTIIDAALALKSQLEHAEVPVELQQVFEPDVLKALSGRFILVTAHRRENWGAGLANICAGLTRWVTEHPSCHIVWPVHSNPAVQASIETALRDCPQTVRDRIHLIKPVGYDALIWLINACWAIATDSGGIQEEASAFNKGLLILRESTERPEVIACGLGQLVGTDPGAIFNTLLSLHNDPQHLSLKDWETSPFGDGMAARRIVDCLIQDLQLQTTA